MSDKPSEETVQDNFYILATAAPADDRTRVLKQGETFAIFDHYGNLSRAGLGEQGLYHLGTRHLSRFELRLGEVRPLLLSSIVREANDLLVVHLTNPDILREEHLIPRGTLHLLRSIFLWQGTCHERTYVSNHGLAEVRLNLTWQFGADFRDIFEVRGMKREQRGEALPEDVTDHAARLGYRGLDGVSRESCLDLSPAPATLSAGSATFEIQLPPGKSQVVCLSVACRVLENGVGSNGRPRKKADIDGALEEVAADLPRRRQHARVETSNEQFNDWLNRSLADLHMLVTETDHGPYPYAGVPWFSTVFGRDGILTALMLLWLDPRIARGVLSYLAAYQAAEGDPARDSDPGKILHEVRSGEMAALREIPFGLYYGSVDSTPLFVLLAGAFHRRTGDLDFARKIWPSVKKALDWIDRHGDRDGDGFVEYFRESAEGLVQQGWKDSHDSVSHADGSLATGPIALCEVQAYVYGAFRGAALLARDLGEPVVCREFKEKARKLRHLFNEKFWDQELGTYVLALDGEKKPCRVRSSNAGQCLLTGIATPSRARRVAQVLLDQESFSGWGIRTLSAREARYNPMSYHNGSVWPHDNALVALGLARYGLKKEAADIMTGLFDASIFVDLSRLPELFCGFRRRAGEGPTLYPVACAPQAWSAAAVFMFLKALLGLSIDAKKRRVTLHRPMLPPSLEMVTLLNLEVASYHVDLRLERQAYNVAAHVLRRDGPVEIVNRS